MSYADYLADNAQAASPQPLPENLSHIRHSQNTDAELPVTSHQHQACAIVDFFT
jgi:hypothetical protein